MKFKALDLFCGAGGASRGLSNAGFDVTGVDLFPQPNYPFKFIQKSALEVSLIEYDFIWASPLCQLFTAYKRRKNHVREVTNFIPEVQIRLGHFGRLGRPYVIENVPGAPLNWNLMLCGSMFGLDVRRHRIFESNFPIQQPRCYHEIQTPRFPPATNRKNLRSTVEVGVWRIPLKTQQTAMGIDWMTVKELSQAIPPAYSQYIGEHALNKLRAPKIR